MQAITVLCLGKCKEPFYRDGCGEYQKRLQSHCKLTVLELPEERLADNPSPAEIKAALAAEGQRILGKIPSESFVVALCVEGDRRTSPGLAKTVLQGAEGLRSSVVFLIGSSYGLSEAVKARADLRLSFSDLTFPHQLMRLILLEQIYRGHRILAGIPYHK